MAPSLLNSGAQTILQPTSAGQIKRQGPCKIFPINGQGRTKRTRVPDKGKLYPIRNIVDEDESRYLIDWEDDEVTGQSYEKSWVSDPVRGHLML
jgi:hypothetical protein